jgi:LysR family glycine cleavage system transcriptional activator
MVAAPVGQLYDAHADIDLRISATVALADFKRDKVDLAVRLGRGTYPGLHSELLFAEALTPRCSPDLLRRKG